VLNLLKYPQLPFFIKWISGTHPSASQKSNSTIKQINLIGQRNILEDEINHLDKRIVPTYQSNFGGYENEYLYQKYKHVLMIDYQEFKERMWQTDFCKNLRGL
jgi:hypothetical protein